MLSMSNTTLAPTIDQRIRRLEVQNRFLIAGLALLLGADPGTRRLELGK